LAPTGISAVNVGGETIHSFFTLKPGFEKEESKRMTLNKYKQKKLRELTTVAIDEISMVRADLLDAVDTILQRARGIKKPFGGVQMIFFGDMYQLPPVLTSADKEMFFSEYKSPYFFEAAAFHVQQDFFSSEFKLKVIELTDIYRQRDKKFITLLNAVRDNTITTAQLEQLNTRVKPNFIPRESDKYIHLMTTNASANAINEEKIKKLTTKEYIFLAEKEGNVARNLYPNDEAISVRIGAQVMFICNDPERRWVNGTIGKVIDIREMTDEVTGGVELVVKVQKRDGIVVCVKRYMWEISKYVFVGGEFQRQKLGTFTQMPIKLAWAITIHKSQGKTFDNVIVDLGRGSFAHGQTYVALSRCSSFEGLVLKKPLTKAHIIMDPIIHSFASQSLSS